MISTERRSSSADGDSMLVHAICGLAIVERLGKGVSERQQRFFAALPTDEQRHPAPTVALYALPHAVRLL